MDSVLWEFPSIEFPKNCFFFHPLNTFRFVWFRLNIKSGWGNYYSRFYSVCTARFSMLLSLFFSIFLRLFRSVSEWQWQECIYLLAFICTVFSCICSYFVWFSPLRMIDFILWRKKTTCCHYWMRITQKIIIIFENPVFTLLNLWESSESWFEVFGKIELYFHIYLFIFVKILIIIIIHEWFGSTVRFQYDRSKPEQAENSKNGLYGNHAHCVSE